MVPSQYLWVVTNTQAVYSARGCDRNCCAVFHHSRVPNHVSVSHNLIVEAKSKQILKAVLIPTVHILKMSPYKFAGQVSINCHILASK
jgi:hypothetical protein